MRTLTHGYRVVWTDGNTAFKRYSIYYTTADRAEEMAESIRQAGGRVLYIGFKSDSEQVAA
jgi:hypothetical protein